MKSYLFVLRTPPHNGVRVQEMLDIILTTAAFDQRVGILLLDDGVFQLKNGQQPSVGRKDTAAIFKALEIYDVHDIYAEAESLQERGIKPGDLCLPIRECYRKDIAALLKQYDVLIGG